MCTFDSQGTRRSWRSQLLPARRIQSRDTEPFDVDIIGLVDRPRPLVSFAQNAEDVILARVFRPWEQSGSWVDVGAGHPKYDSVTHLFSTFGWSGLNIEPQDSDYQLLSKSRPRDVNIRCAITPSSGEVELFVGPMNAKGSSTLVSEFRGLEDNIPWSVERVMGRPLQDLLDQLDITEVDFLKIDVEGSELGVVESINFSRFKAKCVLVEATLPNTQIPSHHEWEPILLAAGYRFALFDGLNRFYFHHSEKLVGELLDSPACVFDDYIRNVEVEQLENLRLQLSNSLRETELVRAAKDQSDIYAKSLEQHLDLLRTAKDQSDTYAKSLETARAETAMHVEKLQLQIRELTQKISVLENDSPDVRSEL